MDLGMIIVRACRLTYGRKGRFLAHRMAEG